ncbi:hypothetical protein [Spirosoma sordidisoli]|uniref:Lipoprotein n=1 Tax=Spirosoma sordidisoli TaxID=2502893 RepID=A0A4Q2USV5_9BACT|nr:hypothetical protein [Spirosoma sordidisoli]RYC70865.1 hypothetical protein EQG79_01555 [Spirosoma sordidisoli]
MLRLILAILASSTVVSCSSPTQTTVERPKSYSAEDSTLLSQIEAAPEPPPRKIDLFNNVDDCRQKLSAVGIGALRRWRFDEGFGWIAASDFYEFGTPGIGGILNNLALYLESPAEGHIETLKLKVNIPNMSSKSTALSKYESAARKTFNLIGEPMPAGLSTALRTGKEYRKDTAHFRVENVFEDGRYDSWKLIITSH